MRTFFRFHLYFYGFSDYFSEFQVFFQKLHILPNIIFLEFWSIFPNHQYFSWFFRSNGIFFRFIYFYLTYNFFFWSIFLDFQYFSDRCPKKGGNWVPGAFFLTDYGWTSLNFDWTDWVSILFHRLVAVSCCVSCSYGHIWVLCAYYASCDNKCTEHDWFYQPSYWDLDKCNTSSTIPHICHFWYATIFIRPVKGTPKKCVNSRQILHRDKTA